MDPVYQQLMHHTSMHHGQYPMYPNPSVMQQLHQQHLQHNINMLPKY